MNLLHSKSFTVTQYLARYFISIDEGERIKTISEFQEDIDVARGTIQNGLQILKDSKGIILDSRGKLGTFLDKKYSNVLLKFADINSIIGVMPLPYTKVYEGLSTGIIEELANKIPVTISMAYMRGASKRIDLVCEGRYDFAVVSGFAAQIYINDNPNSIRVVRKFGRHSYLKGHVLVLRDSSKTEIEHGMRVGIDYDSIDQFRLTQEACQNKRVEIIPMSYTQFTTYLFEDKIDAVIWNADEDAYSLRDFKTVPVQSIKEENTEAVIVVDSKRNEIIKIIEEYVNVDSVTKTQYAIEKGIRSPRY